MKKSKFIELLAQKTGLSRKKAQEVYNCTFDIILENVIEEKSHSISKFGSFSIVQRSERKGINLQTGKAITIPARKVLKFKVSKTVKEKVAKL